MPDSVATDKCCCGHGWIAHAGDCARCRCKGYHAKDAPDYVHASMDRARPTETQL